MKPLAWLVALTLGIAGCSDGISESRSGGWIPLFDGRTLAGWRANENPSTFRVENGTIIVHGPRAHLFYEGRAFTDFELRTEVLTRPGANSGIYIRTRFQPDGWPSEGYEVQINNSQSDWRRTGSLYAVQDVREAGRDDEWFTVHVTVRGRRVRVMIDGRQVVDYTEPAGSPTRLTGGTIALQGHDADSEVHYRNIVVRDLSR
jgi:hypothetical protein